MEVKQKEIQPPYPVEFFNTATAGSALPGHVLKLIKDVIVMLFCNISRIKGHENSVRYILSKVTQKKLQLIQASVDKAGNRRCLLQMPAGPGVELFLIQGLFQTELSIRECFGITAIKLKRSSSKVCLVLMCLNMYFYMTRPTLHYRATHQKSFLSFVQLFNWTRKSVHTKVLKKWM